MHNIGQGHQVKVPVESVHREEVLYKVWWLKALQLSMEREIYVKVTQSRYLQSQYIEEKHYARFDGCRPYS